MPLPSDLQDVTHVTLPMSRGRWAATSATVHRRDLAPQDIVERDGVRVTSPLRTLLDLPSLLSLSASVAAADAAMRAGLVSRTELRCCCAQATGRGARAIRDLFVGRLEFAWPSRKAGLFTDGRGYHSGRDALRHDREQDNVFRRAGCSVPLVTWQHVYLQPTYLLDVARSLLQRGFLCSEGTETSPVSGRVSVTPSPPLVVSVQ